MPRKKPSQVQIKQRLFQFPAFPPSQDSSSSHFSKIRESFNPAMEVLVEEEEHQVTSPHTSKPGSVEQNAVANGRAHVNKNGGENVRKELRISTSNGTSPRSRSDQNGRLKNGGGGPPPPPQHPPSPCPDREKILDEQAVNLFEFCDQDQKGFIVRSDLDRLDGLIPGVDFAQLETFFDRNDKQRVNIVNQRDFVNGIKTLLINSYKTTNNNDSMERKESTESRRKRLQQPFPLNFRFDDNFNTISLDEVHQPQSVQNHNYSPTILPPASDHLFSPTRLTIAINGGGDDPSDGPNGLANIRRNRSDLRLGDNLSIDSISNRNGGNSGISPVSLHDELSYFATGHLQHHPQNQLHNSDTSSPSDAEFVCYDTTNSRFARVSEHLSPTTLLASPGLAIVASEKQCAEFRMRSTCEHSLADELSGKARVTTTDLDLKTPDRIFKVVFVGDSAVGKTCFLHRFCHNRFKPLFNATIGVDFTVKTIRVEDKLVAVQLWDTAGQERFRSITKQYFRKADGVVLMYDVTSEQSFVNVRNWIESVRVGVDDGCVMCLVGNKVDLYPNEECRTITYANGQELAKEFDMLFFESSAHSGQGIHEAMHALAVRLQKREEEGLEEALRLESLLNSSKRSWCCV